MAGKKKFQSDHSNLVVRKLECIRKSLNYSQQQMAGALDVPFRTYQKWVYAEQVPRHCSAILARAEAMLSPRRANCWEILKCGREPGGDKVHLDGPCPASQDPSGDGVNGGSRGGRVCWAISGTFCGREVGGSEAAKLISCFSCDFFSQVLREEGLASFKLLKPGQTYTQR